MKGSLLLVCSLFALIYTVKALGQENPEHQDLAVERIMATGHYIKVPYFGSIRHLKLADWNKTLESFGNLMMFFHQRTKEAIRGIPHWKFTYFWSSFRVEYDNHIRTLSRSIEELEDPEINKFIKAVVKGVSDTVKKAREATRSISSIDKQSLMRNSTNLFQDLIEATEYSPVLFFMHWSRATIDGVPLNSTLVNLAAQLMQTDFWPVFVQVV